MKKHTIIKDSDEEKNFVKELINAIKDINMSDFSNSDCFEKVVLNLASSVKRIWVKNLKTVNITKYSKSWWDINCSRNIEKYKLTRSLED